MDKNNWSFPNLVGSEKQVVWADKIRRDFAKYYSSLGGEPGESEIRIKKAVAIAVSAKFWIENRDYCEKGSWENMTQVLKNLQSLIGICQPWYNDLNQSEFEEILKVKKSKIQGLRIDKAGIVACCKQFGENLSVEMKPEIDKQEKIRKQKEDQEILEWELNQRSPI
ncbi:hypothetical protein [Planktothrix agardhii]|uniref:hypothetical protein n=1 Tax=Planktothrix agardhii TaxID=1160 RepID=UPI0003F8740D|nr:hypothetical protein [Planktothrix agardhii]